MKFVGNLIWCAVFGLWMAIAYFIASVLLCLTIVGIPLGVAYYRLAKLVFIPFGKKVNVDYDARPVGNVVWLVLGGAQMAVSYAVVGGLLCITIIGIPFAKQCFKLMKLSALPYGSEVV